MIFKNGLPELKSKDHIQSDEKICEGNSSNILPTYYIINYEMNLRGLQMPDWFEKKFPINLDGLLNIDEDEREGKMSNIWLPILSVANK